MLAGSFERKSSSENRNEVNMENLELTQACKTKNKFQVCYQSSP